MAVKSKTKLRKQKTVEPPDVCTHAALKKWIAASLKAVRQGCGVCDMCGKAKVGFKKGSNGETTKCASCGEETDYN